MGPRAVAALLVVLLVSSHVSAVAREVRLRATYSEVLEMVRRESKGTGALALAQVGEKEAAGAEAGTQVTIFPAIAGLNMILGVRASCGAHRRRAQAPTHASPRPPGGHHRRAVQARGRHVL